MSTLFRAETGHAAESRRHSIKAVCCVIGLVICALSIGVRAEQAVTLAWMAKGGLHSFFNRHLVRVTVFEAGPATVLSHAVIELRDRTGRVAARKEGDLTARLPLQLDLRVADGAGLIQLRPIITVTNTRGELIAPLVTVEDIHPDLGLVSKLDPPCGPGSGPGSPQASCPGWLILTSLQ